MMTAKPISVWLWLLLLIGSGLAGQDRGVTPRTVASSEEKELTGEEQIQRKLKEELRQAQLREHWGGVSTLIIPVFEIKEATLEEALRKLRVWDILTSLEIAAGEVPARFSLEIRGSTIAQVLHAIVEAAGNYTWEPYESSINPHSLFWIINVFPRGAREDESNLMNVRVPSPELNNVRPRQVIRHPYAYINELARRIWGGPPAYAASEVLSDDLFLSLRLEGRWVSDNRKVDDRSVREIFNEISIRSGFGWVYEPQKYGKLPVQFTARQPAQRVYKPVKYGRFPTWRVLW